MQTQDMKDTLEVYKLKMNQKLSELDHEIQLLKTKALRAHAEQKQQYQQMIDDLDSKRGQMQAKLNELGTKGESAYEEMKAGLEQAWIDLSSAFDRAKASF